MPLDVITHKLQSDLATYCRTDKLPDIPGVRAERAVHYRRLVFNVIEGAIRNAFPIAFNTLEESEWLFLVNDFFTNHNPQAPELWKLAGEFYRYTKVNHKDLHHKYPYLIDLLTFEWVEIEVFMMEDINCLEVNTPSDVLLEPLILNKESALLSLSYPVFAHRGEALLDKKGSYFLFIYRDTESKKVKFSEFSPLAACVSELLKDEAIDGASALKASGEFLGSRELEQDPSIGKELLLQFLNDGILLGVK